MFEIQGHGSTENINKKFISSISGLWLTHADRLKRKLMKVVLSNFDCKSSKSCVNRRIVRWLLYI